MVFKECDKITKLKDFGIRLGSLNDTKPGGDRNGRRGKRN